MKIVFFIVDPFNYLLQRNHSLYFIRQYNLHHGNSMSVVCRIDVTSFLENAAFYKTLSIFLGNTKSQATFYKKNLTLQNIVSFNKTCLNFAYLLFGKWHVLLNALVSVTHYLLICRSIVVFYKMKLYS